MTELAQQGLVGFGRDSRLVWLVYSKLSELVSVVRAFAGDKAEANRKKPKYEDLFPVEARHAGLTEKPKSFADAFDAIHFGRKDAS